MKTYRLLFLFLFVSLVSLGQESAGFKKFAVGINIAPEYAYRTIGVNHNYPTDNNPPIDYIISYRNAHEVPRLGYHIGIYALYYLKEHFNVGLGLNLSKKGYKNNMIYATSVNGIIMSETTLKYNYNYLEIPLKANYILGQKKVRFTAGAGLTPAIFLSQVTVYNGEKQEKRKNSEDFTPINLFVCATVGIDLLLSKHLGLTIEPGYQYGLLKTINAPIKENLWSVGLDVDFCYKF